MLSVSSLRCCSKYVKTKLFVLRLYEMLSSGFYLCLINNDVLLQESNITTSFHKHVISSLQHSLLVMDVTDWYKLLWKQVLIHPKALNDWVKY